MTVSVEHSQRSCRSVNIVEQLVNVFFWLRNDHSLCQMGVDRVSFNWRVCCVADYGNAQKFATFPRNAQMPGAPAYGNEYMGGSNFRGNAGAQQNKYYTILHI